MKTEIFHMKNRASEKPSHAWMAEFLSQKTSFSLQVTEIGNYRPNQERSRLLLKLILTLNNLPPIKPSFCTWKKLHLITRD